ncbi:hypothetical protein HDU80_010677 [Chytriomyces hyalinus]|nr:hypothetical protein HDU80_010677 [Chytriomyces hyalinus]
MQGPTRNTPTPEVTTPEVRSESADGASTSKPKTTTSELEATLPETTSTAPLTALDHNQVPDDQVEVGQDISSNAADGANHHPPVLSLVENSPRSEPAPTSVPTQDDPLDELVTGVESLQVEGTDALQVRFEVVLTRDLEPSIPIANRGATAEIPAPYTVIVTRNGFSLAYTNIHKPEAYIERVLMNEAEF